MNCAQGDLAIIIESVEGAMVGAIVQCISMKGDHALYGPVWRVRSNHTLVSEYGGVGNEVDCPDKWLRPIKPGEMDGKKDIAKLSEKDLIQQVLERAAKLNW